MAKLLENTVAQTASNATNGILRNATIAVSLKYFSNFWRLLEMPLINCKVELNGQSIVFCLQLVHKMLLMMIMLITLFLLSKTQNYMFLW